jgi:hypothetical protein
MSANFWRRAMPLALVFDAVIALMVRAAIR